MAARHVAATTMSLHRGVRRPRRALILGWVATVAALCTPAGGVVVDGVAALGGSDLILMLLSAATGASAAICAHVTARLTGDRRWSWVSIALWFHAFVILPSAASSRTTGVADSTVAHAAGVLLVAAALVFAVQPSWGPGRRRCAVTAGLAAVALSAVDVTVRHDPVVSAVFARESAFDTVFLVSALFVAGVCAASRLRLGSPAEIVGGAGAATIVLAQAHRALLAGGTDPVFPVLRLLGLSMVLAGLLSFASDARRRVEHRVAGLEADLASATAAQQQWRRRAVERDHELRNGLAGLAGLPDLLDRPPPAPDRAPLRRAVESELVRLAAILDGAASASGDYRLATLVADTVALHAPPRTSVDVGPDLWVAGRRSVAGQILANLLINCARHAPGAAVEVRGRRDGDRVLLEVRDDGAPATAAVPGPGRGVGLSLCRQMAEDEGGAIRIEESAPGAGHVVVVALPASSR